MKLLLKYIALALCAMLLLGLFAGCGTQGSTGTTTRPDVTAKPISVVATIFPAYDWARQIIGENNERVALTLLLDKGSDFHSYQPTVEDIYKVSTCDVFIYVGGQSDKWVPDALAQAANPDMTVINLLETLGGDAKEEESVEGMEAEEAESQEEGPEYDEHVWLSLRLAKRLCAAIRDALKEKDPANPVYETQFQAYAQKLEALDQAYTQALENTARKTLLFADRFPFRYLTDDYGLEYFAAFSGCSAETEASFETVNFLVSKADQLQLPWIMKIDSSDSRLAETIIANSRDKNAKILELNSLQAVTAQQVEQGVTYLGVMEQNLEVLITALN